MCVDVHSPPPPPPPQSPPPTRSPPFWPIPPPSPSPSTLGPALSLALHTCTHADKRALTQPQYIEARAFQPARSLIGVKIAELRLLAAGSGYQ
ncbi:hypothetical protein TSMEX_000236 [Taenia solium]|eukprot:TsM_001125200 transcript=TsM_001125200 gene=TsM_001125200